MRDSQVTEGSAAHFEAKLVPVGDPRLRVEWLKDGKILETGRTELNYFLLFCFLST